MPSYRLSAAALAATAALIAVPASAQAHVRVNPDTVAAGGYTTLVFKVPTESATASTTKLEIELPTDHPFGSVSYQPVPGWTTTVTTSKLPKPIKTGHGTITEAPSRIVWTATDAASIKPGQFQTFPVSVGPVPQVSSVMFKTKQTYSDGSVVAWDEPTPASGQEPEHPAPVLNITSASASPSATAAPSGAPSVAAASPDAAPTTQTDGSNGDGVWYGVGGIGIGVIALLAAVYAIVRKPR